MSADTPAGGEDDAVEVPLVEVPPEATRGGGRGGTWLTYRFRFGGEATAEATGTMKAPSFLNAARRILARGLGDAMGPSPAYLRLRAAGKQEVLLRVTRAGGGLQLDVVPGDAYRFAPRPGAPEPPASDPAPARVDGLLGDRG